MYFTAHTIKCVCHNIWSMFGVLGLYNFDSNQKIRKYAIPKEKMRSRFGEIKFIKQQCRIYIFSYLKYATVFSLDIYLLISYDTFIFHCTTMV